MQATRLEAIGQGLHLRHLHPAYFALVMATGIVSIALRDIGEPAIAAALLALNAVLYPALILISLARLLRYPRECAADLADHRRAQGRSEERRVGKECRS